MPAGSTPEVFVIDPLDRELERMLADCGARPSRLNAAELTQLAHPAAHEPDVLVLDLRGRRPVPPALAAFKRQHPTVGVVVVASSAEPALMLEAMRGGANEFLAEPVAVKDLEAAVGRLVAAHVVHTTGDVFAFMGAKGGVGTTTIAVNVATTLARAGQGRVLLIDLHLAHGDAALLLGADPRFSLIDAIENVHRFDEAFFKGLVTPTKAGPDLLASSDRTLAHTADLHQIRAVLEFAGKLYRYVVLDVPRNDPSALDSLDAARAIVIVANQELSTVRGASRLAGELRQRYGKDRVRVIVSRLDKQAEITPEDVQKVVGDKVRHVLPSDYRLALQALNKGRPLALDNHNRLASSYRELAHDLAGISPEPGKKPESGSIFGRLTGR